MSYRILVDENTSPTVADLLGSMGHDAKPVPDALSAGVSDEAIVEYARVHDAVVLTHDDDFLHPTVSEGISILYYSDDTLDASEIATRVDQLTQIVPDPDDLPSVTNLGSWT
jgi:predicted nuclease of predicted toxin-antitoxin system